MTFEQSIKTLGCVEVMDKNSSMKERPGEPMASVYAARITALFMPFLDEEAEERKFFIMQEKLLSLVNECMGKKKIQEKICH